MLWHGPTLSGREQMMSFDPAGAPARTSLPTLRGWWATSGRADALNFATIAVAVGVALLALSRAGGSHESWQAAAALAAVAATTGMLLLGMVRRRGNDHVAASISALLRIAEGDLITPVAVGSDGQAGIIEAAAVEIKQQLRELLTEADQGAQLLGASWRTMNDVAWSMMNTSEGTVSEAKAAAGAAAEVSANMQFIATATEETTATMREVATHASEASVIGQSGVEQITTAGDTVGALQSASRRVEDVLRLINGVARQTHLLALNATIEAARAGEHGHGFTVVASEVKQLAEQTAQATGDVVLTMRQIESGSERAASSMQSVSETIIGMSTLQHSIAAAVEQQTATTHAIARTTATAADQAVTLAANVKSLTDAVRLGAYAGAKARTVAADVAEIEQTIRTTVARYRYEPVASATSQQVDSGPRVATSVGAVTTVRNDVTGTGVSQFNYVGTWGHATGNVEAAGTNAHSSMPGDTCTLRFHGTRIRFYGVVAPNHGQASITIDGGEPAMIDQYAEERQQGGLGWQSPVLPRGEHVFELNVLGESNPNSRYVWVNVDRVEIDA
jgi:methyl-accepting chemotaxis protein